MNSHFLRVVFSLTFLFATHSQADFFKKEDFVVALGGQYSSLLERRGMIVYDGYQAFPIYSVNVFNPDLQLVGSTLNYTW